MRALYCAAILALLTPTHSGAQWGDDAVTLLTTEKALVGARPMAAKEVVAFLVGKAIPNTIITIKNTVERAVATPHWPSENALKMVV